MKLKKLKELVDHLCEQGLEDLEVVQPEGNEFGETPLEDLRYEETNKKIYLDIY